MGFNFFVVVAGKDDLKDSVDTGAASAQSLRVRLAGTEDAVDIRVSARGHRVIGLHALEACASTLEVTLVLSLDFDFVDLANGFDETFRAASPEDSAVALTRAASCDTCRSFKLACRAVTAVFTSARSRTPSAESVRASASGGSSFAFFRCIFTDPASGEGNKLHAGGKRKSISGLSSGLQAVLEPERFVARGTREVGMGCS